MELILRDDVEKLGRRGEIVKVKDGFARNFLLPRGLGMPVTAANKAMIEKERKAHQARLAKEKSEFEQLAARVATLRFIAPRKVGENDVLYGSVTSGDVAEFLKAKGIEIDKRKILLEEPLRQLGVYTVPIKLFQDVEAKIKVWVVKK